MGTLYTSTWLMMPGGKSHLYSSGLNVCLHVCTWDCELLHVLKIKKNALEKKRRVRKIHLLKKTYL